MGGIFGRKKATQAGPNFPNYDPNFASLGPGGYGGPPGYPPYGGPPPYPYGSGLGPNTRFGEYDPYDIYGYGNQGTDTFESFYGSSMRPGPYGGGFGRGKISDEYTIRELN